MPTRSSGPMISEADELAVVVEHRFGVLRSFERCLRTVAFEVSMELTMEPPFAEAYRTSRLDYRILHPFCAV